MFSSGSGMGDAAPSENIPDNGRSNPVLPGQDNQGHTSFQIHETASPWERVPPLLAGHLNPINNTNTVGVGSSRLPPEQPYYVPNPLGELGGFRSEGDVYGQSSQFELGGVTAPNLQSGVLYYSLQGYDPGGTQSSFPARLGLTDLQGAVPNPLGELGGFLSEGVVYGQSSQFELGSVTAPNLQSGVLYYSPQGSDPGGMQSRFPARLGLRNLQGAAGEVPAQEDLSISLDELDELLGNTEQPRKRKRQVRSRNPERDDGPGRAQPQLPQDPKLQELSKDQRYRARKKAREGVKDIDLVELREENVRTRALYKVASSDLKKAEKNIAHFRKNKQDTAKKLQDHLLGVVASVEPRKDKEEWRREIFSQNGNQAFDSLWEIYMSLKNQHMSTLALLIEAVNMKGADGISDGVN